MAGSITVLPARRTGFQEFSDAASPYLQQAFQMMMQRQLQEQQRQRNMELARQTNPDLFTETTPISSYQKFIPNLSVASDLPQGEQIATARKLAEVQGIKIPEKIRKFAFNKEKLGLPAINVASGEVTYKPEDAFNAYYRSLIPAEKGKSSGENIVYRDATGAEVSSEKAQADIESGNTNYFLNKREITKSGVKEIPLAKPEDLQKMQSQKNKSAFIIDQAQDNLNTISEIEKGMGYFGLSGIIPAIPGLQPEKVNWQTNINKLLSGKMIDLMTQMKEASKTGATGFGQLSEKEGQILREASTALKKELSPQDAQRYLNVMKTTLQKVISGNRTQQLQGQEDFSAMSDEELRRIASGG